MIQVNNLDKSFSGQVLFEDLSFNLQPGERIGLVGRNGAGKSTLFSIILGKLAPDAGVVSIPKGYTLGSLDQHIHFTKPTVMEECCQVLVGDAQFDYYKAEKILFGLGFSDEDMQKDPNSFSGGFQIRINLTKCLLVEPSLLLLDEPTNYLDILSLRWLRQFLKTFPGEVLLITHNRDFMDSVTTHTMGLYRRGLKKIKGKSANFYEQMEIEDEMYEKTRVNQDKKRAHLESFIDRFGAKASKATQAQSKKKQLDKMDKMGKLEGESQMGLSFHYKDCQGKVLLEAEKVSFSYDGDDMDLLFKDITLAIGRHERIGIIGKNGKGKSTLLNLIAGELKPNSGTVETHPSISMGHLGQTNVSRLSNTNTIIQELQAENTDLSMTAVRNICGSLMFNGDMALKKISVLSGGEKNRVLLGKIMANKTNFLLLDEPTNHLDMDSIDVLTDELVRYKGAIAVVTHSEELLRRVVNKLVIFHKGGAEVFNGGYNEFLEKIGWEEEGPLVVKKVSKLSKKEAFAKRKALNSEKTKKINPIKKKIYACEEEVMALEEKLNIENKKMSEASNSGDNALVISLSTDIGVIQKKIQTSFESMEEYEAELSKYTQEYDKLLADL